VAGFGYVLACLICSICIYIWDRVLSISHVSDDVTVCDVWSVVMSLVNVFGSVHMSHCEM
jgi:hypothetical protein